MSEKTVVSFTKPTPEWAKLVFRIVFCFTTAASFWVAATSLIPEPIKLEVVLALKALDFVIWGLGKGLGVKKEDYEN